MSSAVPLNLGIAHSADSPSTRKGSAKRVLESDIVFASASSARHHAHAHSISERSTQSDLRGSIPSMLSESACTIGDTRCARGNLSSDLVSI